MKWSFRSGARQWRRPWGGSATPGSRVDPETGLQCLTGLRASAEAELARAARFHRPLAVLVIAIQPRSRPGPPAIQRFAASLRRHTRGFDLIGRAEDGSFVVLLPEAGRAEALAVAGRIQHQGLTGSRPASEGAQAVNALRVGVATFPEQGMLLDELLTSARANLAAPAPAPTPKRVHEADRDERRLNRFILAVILAGVAANVAAVPFLASPRSLMLILPFLLLSVVAERLTNLVQDKTSESLGSIALLAAGALGGPAAGILAGSINGLAHWYFCRKPPQKGLYNTSNLALSGAAAGLPYWWLGGLPALSASPMMLVPGLVAGVLCFVTNMVLLAQVVALASGTSFRTEWRVRCNWLAVHYAVIGAISLGLALLYQSYGLTGLLLLLGPVGLLHYAQRQYVTHTAAHVAELSTLNQELTGSNGRLTAANERLEHTLGDLRLANESMLTALCEALELRDQETEGHSQRVVRYARSTAIALGLGPDEVQAVVHGAHLHDIGKIGVADAILRKPGPLTPDEWIEMKKHPEIGYRMIEHIPFLAPAAVLVRHHHERWDGRGYPAGLGGVAIPIGARIFAVVDSFDAMTSDRPYRAGMPIETALAELTRNRGTQYDPDVVDSFIDLVRSGAIEVQRQPAAHIRDTVVEVRDVGQRRTVPFTTIVSVS